MGRLVLILAAAITVTCSSQAYAARTGSHGSGGPGAGSKASHGTTHGYNKKDGTRVQTYSRTTPDRTQKNNYSAKGNSNPRTGKTGTKSAKR